MPDGHGPPGSMPLLSDGGRGAAIEAAFDGGLGRRMLEEVCPGEQVEMELDPDFPEVTREVICGRWLPAASARWIRLIFFFSRCCA